MLKTLALLSILLDLQRKEKTRNNASNQKKDRISRGDQQVWPSFSETLQATQLKKTAW